ncbi:MAG: hypothetical protein UV05_C0006G0006 [candidate division CPR1 bacterium GW2011_GWA2_42_17]|uniref:DUF2304 domain-containing protein n=1 Tax=candidate division CPR1 bacterium GW2011_GWA2_42_17 TaxID=1618341 RepID=A0A0G0Z6V4_9BACT|nr:MAG: hypothetical protein UV05_C0006G0006 [candidate division CPR1 bacterium GW2011_GWA2_42_17]
MEFRIISSHSHFYHFMLFRIFALLFITGALWLTNKQHKAGRMRGTIFFAWCALWLAGAVVVAVPDLASVVAFYLGIGRGVDLVLYGALALGSLFIFSLSARLYKIEKDLSHIVKALALKDLPKKEEEHKVEQKSLL